MPKSPDKLTVNIEGIDQKALLDDWKWLIDDGMTIILITAMGDLFLRNKNDQIFWLDVMSGTFEQVAQTLDEFKDLITITENIDNWFMPTVMEANMAVGMILKPGQCYSLDIPLFLGGQLVPENVKPADIMVHLSINGQILQQVKDLPPGTPIHKIKIKRQRGKLLIKRLFGYIFSR